MSVFVGMQPVFTHVPPKNFRSTMATVCPALARRFASDGPRLSRADDDRVEIAYSRILAPWPRSRFGPMCRAWTASQFERKSRREVLQTPVFRLHGRRAFTPGPARKGSITSSTRPTG